MAKPDLSRLATPALIKHINALAEDAGAICRRHGLALADTKAVLAAAKTAGLPTTDYRQLAAIFEEIAVGKTILANRKRG